MLEVTSKRVQEEPNSCLPTPPDPPDPLDRSASSSRLLVHTPDEPRGHRSPLQQFSSGPDDTNKVGTVKSRAQSLHTPRSRLT